MLELETAERADDPSNATPDSPVSTLAGPLGATCVPGGVVFRVWAPDADSVAVETDGGITALARGGNGVWSGSVAGAGAGLRYRYRVNDAWGYPDPYSRSQPEGPHGPSEVVDPQAFTWSDASWRGLSPHGLVIYELHVGAYTSAGTFDALIGELDALRDLGVSAIELMPVAEFPGERNWGYDGVDLFAPSHAYGGPGGLKRLVDAAHARGLGVILDVVYNHFGPDGNYLLQYARDYLTDRHSTPWGDAVNFDGPNSAMVRRFVLDNVVHWLQEYHIDGLRLDATFAIRDDSPRHILAELTEAARAAVAGERGIVLIAETYENDTRYLLPASAGGHGFDAVWADDFHHALHAYAAHEQSGYYVDYAGTLDEVARTINRGWLYEGQASRHFASGRGTRSGDLPARCFVYAIQNHDQVGNRAFGRRFSHLVGGALNRPWSALLLILPYTPLIFMGQEFAASSRFYYFTDHHGELGREISRGRRSEYARIAGIEEGHLPETPDPQAEETFAESKLELTERADGGGAQTWAMHRELLSLRREDPVLSRQDRHAMRATSHGDVLILHLWHGRDERIAVANFGVAVDATPEACGIPRDLAARRWSTLFSTEAREFGGSGEKTRFDGDLISLPPHSLTLLAARRKPFPLSLADAAARRLHPLRRRGSR